MQSRKSTYAALLIVVGLLTPSSAVLANSALPASLPAFPQASTQDDIDNLAALYGQQYDFEILRNGSNVGQHRLTFTRSGGNLNVVAQSSLRIALGPITLYRFAYRSSEIWNKGRLEVLVASTNDDGEISDVRSQFDGMRLTVQGPKGSAAHEGPLFATNHWNAGVLSTKKVINTLTGELSKVEVQYLGRDKLVTRAGTIDASRWRYSGDIDATVWYDDSGRWLALGFTGRDGSQIEYRCTVCTSDGSLLKSSQKKRIEAGSVAQSPDGNPSRRGGG